MLSPTPRFDPLSAIFRLFEAGFVAFLTEKSPQKSPQGSNYLGVEPTVLVM